MTPAGEVYDWFVRGRTLLESGNPQAAAELLRHARTHEPSGDLEGAVEQLALSVAMRPPRREYDQALRQVRATLRAQLVAEGGSGPGGVESASGPGGAE